MIYFFSSDQRKLYSEDVINTVSYPTGFILHFRYRTKYVQNQVIEKLKELEGETGIIIFVNTRETDGTIKEGDPSFYPLRLVEFLGHMEEGDRIHFYLKLKSDMVDYENLNETTDKLQNFIERLRDRPIKETGKEYLTGKFVVNSSSDLESNYYFNDEKLSSYETKWEKIVDILLDYYYKNIFYRFKLYSKDPRISQNELYYIEPRDIGDKYSRGFKIKGGKSYFAKITYKQSDKHILDGPMRQLEVKDPNNFLSINQPRIPLGTIVDTQVRIIRAKRSYKGRHTTIQIKSDESNTSNVFEIWFKAELTWWLFIPFLIFFIGLILQPLSNISSLALLGSGISTIALFVLQYIWRS